MNSDKKRIAELETKVIRLESLIEKLLDKIEDLTHRKNSLNSSVSPSKDENRPLKNQSLRTKSSKKPGGQPGHEGTTLKMVENPDQIINHKPDFCNCCGNDLSDKPEELLLKRQVVDIPVILPKYTEHRIFKKTCSCGHQNKSVFPENVKTTISYGANVQATIAYMHTRQYLPFERMSEYFKDVCNLPISQGTICNLLDGFALKAQPVYDLIAQKVSNEKVVGADETGIRVNGKNGWFWTWQSKFATFVVFSKNRGTATIDTNFSQGFHDAVLVHDCWASHFQTQCKTHQLCIAHLLRELIFLEQRFESNWATNFKRTLYEALELKKNLDQEHYNNPILERDKIRIALDALLENPLPENQKKLRAFHKRMIKHKEYILTFLHHFHVPPDNNASERAIRNVKVKQKVSGQFKTENGAQIYAVIRSVTDTCIKNGQNILAAFKTIAILKAE
ncbi:IS66 family transposase [Flavobacterium polysaccharolyticum]|uniref:IS66 family transposase n=1 Tax=Flavobacterium polysaccharolyticum TaxID=3133148 RepID=A0ABU9NTX7_9FLAO